MNGQKMFVRSASIKDSSSNSGSGSMKGVGEGTLYSKAPDDVKEEIEFTEVTTDELLNDNDTFVIRTAGYR